jgi:hypothetical protein
MTEKLQCKLILALNECVSEAKCEIFSDEGLNGFGVKVDNGFETYFGEGGTYYPYMTPIKIVEGVLQEKEGESTANSIILFREILQELRSEDKQGTDTALGDIRTGLLPAIKHKVENDFVPEDVCLHNSRNSQQAEFIEEYIGDWLQQHYPKANYAKEYDDIRAWLKEHYPPYMPKPFTPWPPLASAPTTPAKPSAVEALAAKRAAKPTLCCVVQ